MISPHMTMKTTTAIATVAMPIGARMNEVMCTAVPSLYGTYIHVSNRVRMNRHNIKMRDTRARKSRGNILRKQRPKLDRNHGPTAHAHTAHACTSTIRARGDWRESERMLSNQIRVTREVLTLC